MPSPSGVAQDSISPPRLPRISTVQMRHEPQGQQRLITKIGNFDPGHSGGFEDRGSGGHGHFHAVDLAGDSFDFGARHHRAGARLQARGLRGMTRLSEWLQDRIHLVNQPNQHSGKLRSRSQF